MVLYRCVSGEDSQAEPGAASATFSAGELVCAALLGDAGEDRCGVSVLSLTASSASSSLCCTEDRYCSRRLQSALPTPSLPLAKPLRTGPTARTVFRESAVPLLRRLSSCASCWSLVDGKPESGKETSVLGGLVVLEATGGAALQSLGGEIWAGVVTWVTAASCCSTHCFHCCIAWNYMQITPSGKCEVLDKFLETTLHLTEIILLTSFHRNLTASSWTSLCSLSSSYCFCTLKTHQISSHQLKSMQYRKSAVCQSLTDPAFQTGKGCVPASCADGFHCAPLWPWGDSIVCNAPSTRTGF